MASGKGPLSKRGNQLLPLHGPFFNSYNGRYRDPDQVTCSGRKEGNVLFNDTLKSPVMEGRKEMFYLTTHLTHLLWKGGRKCFI